MNTIVEWNDPDIIPELEFDEVRQFWIAIEYPKRGDDITKVFDCYYINKPLRYYADDILKEYLKGEPLEDCSGQYIDAVGWYHRYYNKGSEEYFEPLNFHEDYKLLGWAEYSTPKFTR